MVVFSYFNDLYIYKLATQLQEQLKRKGVERSGNN